MEIGGGPGSLDSDLGQVRLSLYDSYMPAAKPGSLSSKSLSPLHVKSLKCLQGLPASIVLKNVMDWIRLPLRLLCLAWL